MSDMIACFYCVGVEEGVLILTSLWVAFSSLSVLKGSYIIHHISPIFTSIQAICVGHQFHYIFHR
jgi:hypothetical protein